MSTVKLCLALVALGALAEIGSSSTLYRDLTSHRPYEEEFKAVDKFLEEHSYMKLDDPHVSFFPAIRRKFREIGSGDSDGPTHTLAVGLNTFLQLDRTQECHSYEPIRTNLKAAFGKDYLNTKPSRKIEHAVLHFALQHAENCLYYYKGKSGALRAEYTEVLSPVMSLMEELIENRLEKALTSTRIRDGLDFSVVLDFDKYPLGGSNIKRDARSTRNALLTLARDHPAVDFLNPAFDYVTGEKIADTAKIYGLIKEFIVPHCENFIKNYGLSLFAPANDEMELLIWNGKLEQTARSDERSNTLFKGIAMAKICTSLLDGDDKKLAASIGKLVENM